MTTMKRKSLYILFFSSLNVGVLRVQARVCVHVEGVYLRARVHVYLQRKNRRRVCVRERVSVGVCMCVCVFMGVCVLTAAKSREEDVSAKYLGCGAIHVSKVVRLFFF